MKLVDVFKALGDDTRIRIFNVLRQYELRVYEIEAVLEITQSNASRHLNKLKNAGILDCEKKSQWVYYFIASDFLEKDKILIDYLDGKMLRNSKLSRDSARLRIYKRSSISCDLVKESITHNETL